MTSDQESAGPAVAEPVEEPSQEYAVRTWDLSKQFREQMAVDRLTLAVPRGTIFGLIGPSGCGKTTTVRLLTGYYKPTAGRARVLDRDTSEFNQDLRTRIGYMPQEFVLYNELSVWHNLRFAGSIYGIGPRSRHRMRELLQFVRLDQDRKKRVSQISGGMRRRLSLAATLAHDPELLFLDEPTAGIDPVLRRRFWDYFDELKGQGRTLFVTTQYVGEAAYCDLVGLMIAGKLIVVDSPAGLRRRAFGGDVLDLELNDDLDAASEAALRERKCVLQLTHTGPHRYRVVVGEASTATPQIVQWFASRQTDIVSVEETLPAFDDVFVKLVEEAGEGE